MLPGTWQLFQRHPCPIDFCSNRICSIPCSDKGFIPAKRRDSVLQKCTNLWLTTANVDVQAHVQERQEVMQVLFLLDRCFQCTSKELSFELTSWHISLYCSQKAVQRARRIALSTVLLRFQSFSCEPDQQQHEQTD